jgi:hypothetical protein
MSEEIIIDSNNRLEYRKTPWDTRALGFPTNEILSINYSDSLHINQLLRQFSEISQDAGIRFSYCRINSSDIALKNALQKSGYYYAETSALISKHDIHREDFGAIFRNDLVLSIPQTDIEFQQLRLIAQNAFQYSRFHEDPNIELELAKKRYYHWIDDLRAQKCSFLTYSTDGVIHAFFAYTLNNNSATLLLGGSDTGKGFLSPSFWSSCLTDLKNQDIKHASGIISVANIGIFNIYSRFNFTVEKVMLGFHRIFSS